MKKLITITVLMALAIAGFAQPILHYDFSAVCETGQTLYYHITSEENHTVTLTYPCSEETPGFESYYDYHIAPQGDILLPSIVTHNGVDYTVTAIDHDTFCYCKLTGDLIIPEGVTSIGIEAFTFCSFTSVFIPQSVSFIASSSLTYCYSLESISVDEANATYYSENNTIIRREDNALVVGCKTSLIPDGVEIICSHAFAGASDGGSLALPNTVRIIEEGAFFQCHFSGSIFLSEALEIIAPYAFTQSDFSGSLTIPNSVTEIGHNAFSRCYGLTGNLTLSTLLSAIDVCAFANCHFSGILTIPDSVTQIEYFAFEGNNFSGLVLGDSVATIGHAAFMDCNNMMGVLRLPHSLTEIGTLAFKNTFFNEIFSPNRIPPTLASNAFQGYDANIPIHIPFGCTEVYQNAEGWNYFSNFIETEMNIEGEWYYEIENENGTITYQHLECVGDTLFEGGKRPKIIIRSNTQYDKDLHTEVTHEYVYEENGKVFWWNKRLGKFTVLYDFSAEVGDEWIIEVGDETIITRVYDSEIQYINGIPYKKLTIADQDNVFSGNLLSTIGHMTSFFPERLMTRGKGYRVDGLRCYWVEDELVFYQGNENCDAIYAELHNGVGEDGSSTGSGTLTVYPNPANSVLFVRLPQCDSPTADKTEYRITNLMGQALLSGRIDAENQQIDISALPAGMYFISVGETTRKFVVK
jgi:hypothetical protein